MIKKINASEFKQNVLNSKGKCVVDFSATWCGPCQMLAPVLEELSDNNNDVAFYNVDIDESSDLAAEWGVMYVPTVFIFNNGKEITHFVGVKSKEEIKDLIK